MKREIASLLGIATGVALAACANSTPHAKEAVMSTASAQGTSNKMPAKWPLKFESHSFGAFCYDTTSCLVRYAGQEHGDDKPSPPSSTYGPRYLAHLNGSHGQIRNFPAAAKVSWRSKDGQPHEAEIDIAEIFADQMIRHNVKRGHVADLPSGEYEGDPSILLEINDRIIRVWMKAFIPTKEPQVAGKPNSDAVYEPVLVETYTY